MGAGKTSASACSRLRTAYNDCFNRWYTEKYLKGQWDKEECKYELEAYRACIMKHMEDKSLGRLLQAEALMQSRQDDLGQPLDTEDSSE